MVHKKCHNSKQLKSECQVFFLSHNYSLQQLLKGEEDKNTNFEFVLKTTY
jgi:hypothetical protein